MRGNRATRGSGALEDFLAAKRAKLADSLIPEFLRTGCVMDLGCGSYPVFLTRTRFARKIGLDQVAKDGAGDEWKSRGIETLPHDLASDTPLPAGEESCQVVTMLAVIEHLAPDRVKGLLEEVHRVLAPGGLLIVTTPASWTDPILRAMAALRLVSPVEIAEHKTVFSRSSLRLALADVFDASGVRVGFFEAYMNLWAVARR